MMRTFVLFAAALCLAVVLGCEDNSEYCADWKASGWCQEYRDQLLDMCAKTCGFCGGGGGGGGGSGGDAGVAVDPRPSREPETPELCRDACATKDCVWFKSQGHCEQYSAVMMENCASTCGWCGARLCSPPDVENGWTDFEMTMIPAGANANVFCYDGYSSVGSSVLSCNSYGELDGSPSCRGADSGDGYAQDETACQRAANAAMSSSYADGQYVIPQGSTHYVPKCDYSGNFVEIQFDAAKGETFCVDPYGGSEVQGTRIRGLLEYISCAPGSAAEYYASLPGNDQGGYDQSGYDQGGYDYNSGYDQGGYDYGSGYDEGGYDQGGYDQGAYEYDQGGYDQGGYDQGGYDQGGYDQGGYDQGGYDQGGYDQGGYDQGDYDQGGYDQGGYDQGGYDQGGYEEEYYNYDTSTGDDYYSGGDSGYEVAGGEDYYNYDYSSGGDAFDGSSYYAEASDTDVYGGRYYDTGDVEAEEEFSVSNALVANSAAADAEEVAVEVEAEAEVEVEVEAAAVMIKDVNEKRRRRKKMRNKRSIDEEEFEEYQRRNTKRGRKRKPNNRRQPGSKVTVIKEVCIDKIRPDLCRVYQHLGWCTTEVRYMTYYCAETCEMCMELNMVTYEDKKRLETQQEQENMRIELEEKRRKEEELRQYIEEEKLLCETDLKECATDIEVKDIVQKAADGDYIEGGEYTEGELSSELIELWATYDPSIDSECRDHQYGVTCSGHKSRGQCQNKPFYMLQNCKKTCEMCAPIMCNVPNDIDNGYTDPGMPVPPGFKIFLSCEDSFYLLGRGTLTCQKDGYYSPGGECIKMTDSLLYKMTACQREKYRKSQPVQLPEVGWIIPEYELVPECDTRGEYIPMQCNRCCCFCVNLNGKEITDTRFTHASGERPDCSPYEYNKRPADKYFPSERSKGVLYGRRNEEDEFDNYSRKNVNKRTKRTAQSQTTLFDKFMEIDFFSCNDVSPQCKKFAMAGSCLTEAPYMTQFCPRSCGTCPMLAYEGNLCEDRRENCEMFISAGYCSFFKNYMIDNCAKTCGFCGNATVCPSLIIDNGSTFPHGSVVAGSIIQISCNDGFELADRGWLRCSSNGDYDRTPGTCLPISNSTDCWRLREYSSRELFNLRFGDFVTPYDAFSPVCNEYGEFHEMQCYESVCWCVDIKTGEEIPRTRGNFNKPRPCNPTPQIYRRYKRFTDISDDMFCSDFDPTRCIQNKDIDPEYCYKYPADAFYNCKQTCNLCTGDNSQMNTIIKSCPPITVMGGYTEPYHPVLPGNSVKIYCDGEVIQRTICQYDGSYLPRATDCSV